MDPQQREQRIQTICLLILASIGVALTLYWLRSVMIPFVLAVFCAIGLNPLIELMIRYLKAPRTLAILSTLIIVFLLLNIIAALLSTSVSQITDNAEAYQAQLARLLEWAADVLELEQLGQFNPASQISVGRISSLLLSTTNAVLGIVSQGFLVMVFLLFLLLGGSSGESGGVWGEVESQIRRYLVTKAVISAATGLLVGTVLMILGVDLAIVFGLFAFLLNFIPSIGSVIATLLPLPVVLLSPDLSGTEQVLAIALPAVIQILFGNVIEPKVLGQSLDLHPISILLALVVWGMLWGIVGMLLATPLTAIMKILFERLELTAPLGDILAGRMDRLRSG